MGRHSAPDDDTETTAVAVQAPSERRPRPGRHARPEDVEDEQPTQAAGVEAEPASPAPVGKGNQSTAADLELLRRHSDVRARVIAAVVVPFVLYTAVLYAISAIDVYFIWVWIPLVTAGVVAGSILDAAHRKRGSG
jgi:hypothetical protein